jgi:aldehyde dehydrogenase
MQINPDLIRSLVQEVLSQMGPVNAANIGGVTKPDRLGVFQTADEAVAASTEAFLEFKKRPMADRKIATELIRSICKEQAEELARLELEETKVGRIDHKIEKLNAIIQIVQGVEDIKPDVESGDLGVALTEYAPFGVIGAITPVTHSLPTLACNGINMLAAGNTVVFNAHPSGSRIAAEGVRRFNAAIRKAIGIDNLMTIIDPPTLESAQALFDHRGVSLLVVTGGPMVARAALASKKRAIVAGPGNPPVVVDATADLERAAAGIIKGASYDNNLLCIGEKQVFAVAEIFDKLMEAMSRHGGYRLSHQQVQSLTTAAFPVGSDGKPHLNKDLIGKDPAVLAAAAGFSVPAGTQLLYGETGEDHPFVQTEQMMPFVPFVRVSNVDRAITLAKASEHGYGHTAILHSRDTEVMTKMGKAMECTIFVINGPSTDGLGLGGAGQASFSIAGPTGEGITIPRTFTRRRRTTVVGAMRFIS